jgi:hypothetical protein
MNKLRCTLSTTFYLLILLSTIAINSHGQEGTPIDLDKAKSQLQKDREKIFIEALQLSISQAAVFHPIYVKFNNEKRALDDEMITLFVNYGNNYQHLDLKLMTTFVAQSEKYQAKELSVRKKYYKLLSEAISIEIGSQFYEVDDFISTSLRLNILTGLPFTGAITRQKDSQTATAN